MKIKFEKERKIFTLMTNNYMYALHINKYNYLIHLYSGNPISTISKERTSERYMERYAFVNDEKEIQDEDYYFSMFASQFECAPYGKLDKRNPFMIVNDETNIDITNFLYKSHKIYKGFDKNHTLPHPKLTNCDCLTLEITLKDEYRDIFLKLYYTVLNKYDCIIRHSKLINKTDKDITVTKFGAMEHDFPDSDYEILAYQGSWGWERKEERIKLNHSLTEISDNHGGRGFYYNPSVILKKTSANLDQGVCYGYSIMYSGDFSYQFKVDEINQTRMIASYNSENTSFIIEPNKEEYSFAVLEIFSNNGINNISHQFHDIARNHIINKNFVDAERPILINSWEAMFMDFDTDKLIKFIDKAKQADIELVVLDDGWFGKRNSDNSSLGDWFINKDKIDLKKVSDYAHQIGLKFGIWIEPEMISPDSQLYRKNKDFALYPDTINNPTLQRHQLVLDIINDKARENVLNQLYSIFDNIKFDYVKWDFNRFLSEAYSKVLDKKHVKETYHRFVKASYQMLEAFTTRYPDILLETCASGGGRYDLSMLLYSPQIWCSDETDIALRNYINYSTNIFYPLSSIGTHISARKIGSIQDKACLAFFGTFGYELDITKLNDEEIAKIKEMNSLFKQYHHIVTLGDYYSIFNPYQSNYAAWNVVTKDKKECAVYFINNNKEQTLSRFIKLKGLNPNYYYFNSLTNDIYTGDFYMEVGLNISCELQSYTSMLFILKQVPQPQALAYRKFKQVDGGVRTNII